MKKTCLLTVWKKIKKSYSQTVFNIEDEKTSVSCSPSILFASSEKVFTPSPPRPPIFEPVQLTLQTRIRLKYLPTLCFNMLLSIR